jgi:thioredoxin-related protein
MKALFALCCFLTVAMLCPALTAGEWFTDFEKAKAESAKTGRPIYILFTNPDAAVSLSYERNIFSQKKFLDYADKKLVLMKVEFPVAIHRQPKGLREQNSELKAKFGITVMPAALLVDANGDLHTNFVKADGGMEKHRRKFNEIMDFDPPKRYTEYLDGFVKTYKAPEPKKVEEPQQPKAEAKAPAKRPARRPARKPDATAKPAADTPVIIIPDADGGTPLIPLDPEGDFQEWLKARSEEEAEAKAAGDAAEKQEEGKDAEKDAAKDAGSAPEEQSDKIELPAPAKK